MSRPKNPCFGDGHFRGSVNSCSSSLCPVLHSKRRNVVPEINSYIWFGYKEKQAPFSFFFFLLACFLSLLTSVVFNCEDISRWNNLTKKHTDKHTITKEELKSNRLLSFLEKLTSKDSTSSSFVGLFCEPFS